MGDFVVEKKNSCKLLLHTYNSPEHTICKVMGFNSDGLLVLIYLRSPR